MGQRQLYRMHGVSPLRHVEGFRKRRKRFRSNASRSAKKPYSVLLLYPDDVNDSGTETYYTFVEAPDAIEAVAAARREAVTAQEESAVTTSRTISTRCW